MWNHVCHVLCHVHSTSTYCQLSATLLHVVRLYVCYVLLIIQLYIIPALLLSYKIKDSISVCLLHFPSFAQQSKSMYLLCGYGGLTPTLALFLWFNFVFERGLNLLVDGLYSIISCCGPKYLNRQYHVTSMAKKIHITLGSGFLYSFLNRKLRLSLNILNLPLILPIELGSTPRRLGL